MTDDDLNRRLDRIEDAMWGPPRNPEAGLVSTVKRVEGKQEEARRQNMMILVGVVVAIITPAATILLTRATG
jgi:hypothetical protein